MGNQLKRAIRKNNLRDIRKYATTNKNRCEEAFFYACAFGRVSAVTLLLELGTPSILEGLDNACYYGHYNVFMLLFNHHCCGVRSRALGDRLLYYTCHGEYMARNSSNMYHDTNHKLNDFEEYYKIMATLLELGFPIPYNIHLYQLRRLINMDIKFVGIKPNTNSLSLLEIIKKERLIRVDNINSIFDDIMVNMGFKYWDKNICSILSLYTNYSE